MSAELTEEDDGFKVRTRLKLHEKALRNRYDLGDEVRGELVQQARCIMNMHPDARTRVAAMRVLVAADTVDVRRESIEAAGAVDSLTAASSALKVVMKGPEARAMMAKLSERICAPEEVTVDANREAVTEEGSRTENEGVGSGHEDSGDESR